MKIGRFVVDSHVHAQRFAAGDSLREAGVFDTKGGAQWEALSKVMFGLEPFENSERLLYDMEAYGVDACVLLPAFGMSNEINAGLVERYPEKFVAVCNVSDLWKRIGRGEEEWSLELVCSELDTLLATGLYVGIGEILPYMPFPYSPNVRLSQTQTIENLLQIMDVARRHNVSVRYHTGCPMGYAAEYSFGRQGPANLNPLWAHDLASAFPDVPIVFDHGGVPGWWWERLQEECLHVAAAHDNVYVETGLWWRELYDKALADPNVGPDKLLWGTDWGASLEFHSQPGRQPESYPLQIRSRGLPQHQIDFWGWSMRQVQGLRIPQDDLNLIVGGNAARLYGMDLPHSRLLRERRV
jgi:predicted TIM-barrel fold metal-dependent hydrolase